MRQWSICELSGRTTVRLGCIGPTLPRHEDGTAGTTKTHHHCNYRRTASLSVMTTGRGAVRGWASPPRGRTILLGQLDGWSSGRTKPEQYRVKLTARPRNHSEAGRSISPMHGTLMPKHQPDARDSEPRNGPGIYCWCACILCYPAAYVKWLELKGIQIRLKSVP
jgi:hypothetical protein